MRRLIRHFRRDRRGVSAIEFAFIAPVLIFFYFGLAEFSGALLADRLVNLIASEIADLATQTTSLSASDRQDLYTISKTLIAPLPSAPLSIRLTELSADGTGKVTVAYSEVSPGSGWVAYTPGNPFAAPTGLIAAGTSIMLCEVQYTYTSPVSYFIKTPWNFTQSFYLEPRQSTSIAWTS